MCVLLTEELIFSTIAAVISSERALSAVWRTVAVVERPVSVVWRPVSGSSILRGPLQGTARARSAARLPGGPLLLPSRSDHLGTIGEIPDDILHHWAGDSGDARAGAAATLTAD